MTDESTNYDENEDDNESVISTDRRKRTLKDGKKENKRQKKHVEHNKIRGESQILNQFLQPSEESSIEEDDDLPTRRPVLQNRTNQQFAGDRDYIRHLESKLQSARNVAVDMHKQFEEKMKEDNTNSTGSNCLSNFNIFAVHDKIYDFNKEQDEKELRYDSAGKVHLGENVFCTRNAFDASFKTDSPSKCIAILSGGVYGLEDLFTRTVRRQGNTLHLRELSRVVTRVIERKTYALMRVKDYTISQVDYHIKKFNAYHRQAITNASSKLQYQKKLKEKAIQEKQKYEIELAA